MKSSPYKKTGKGRKTKDINNIIYCVTNTPGILDKYNSCHLVNLTPHPETEALIVSYYQDSAIARSDSIIS